MIKAANDAHLCLEDLLVWGDRVGSDWKMKNIFTASSDTAAITKLSAQICCLHEDVVSNKLAFASIQLENIALREELNSVKGMLQEVVQHLRYQDRSPAFSGSKSRHSSVRGECDSLNRSVPSPDSSASKRRRTDSDLDRGGEVVDTSDGTNAALEMLGRKPLFYLKSLADVTLANMIVNWFRFKLYQDSKNDLIADSTIRDKV